MAVIGIVGPTASGKTALSLELAEALGGADSVEIVSADAMQLYRGMDVGTAKISPAERRGIVHRQIDVLDVLDEASVAAYQRSARADVDAILAAGKTPVVVGGSGLYVSGLLDRLDFPGRDRRVRAELESLLEREGPGPLLEELARKDPQAYEAMDLANTRRLVRALEAIRVTALHSALSPAHRPLSERSPFRGVPGLRRAQCGDRPQGQGDDGLGAHRRDARAHGSRLGRFAHGRKGDRIRRGDGRHRGSDANRGGRRIDVSGYAAARKEANKMVQG